MRTWPLSTLVHKRYQARMGPERWNAINEQSRRVFEAAGICLAPDEQRSVEDLRRDGIHCSSIDALVDADVDFGQLRRHAETLMQRPGLRRQITMRRSEEGTKWYVVRAFGFRPKMKVPRIFAELCLDDRILRVVNSYLGVAGRLKYLDVWHNFPVSQAESPVSSESWHRDQEDKRIVKLFLYLSDVDEASGPLVYLKGTQPGGPYGSVFPNETPRGSFPPEADLEAKVPGRQIETCCGSAGTLLFYDAAGFHKGGRTTLRPRLLLVATYASDAALDQAHYRLEDAAQYETLGPMARYAIRDRVR